jgi:hypothetical protein
VAPHHGARRSLFASFAQGCVHIRLEGSWILHKEPVKQGDRHSHTARLDDTTEPFGGERERALTRTFHGPADDPAGGQRHPGCGLGCGPTRRRGESGRPWTGFGGASGGDKNCLSPGVGLIKLTKPLLGSAVSWRRWRDDSDNKTPTPDINSTIQAYPISRPLGWHHRPTLCRARRNTPAAAGG